MQVANAYWLQADLNIEGILVGAQYTDMTLKDNVTSVTDGASQDIKTAAAANGLDQSTTAYAVMLGYEMKDVVTVKAAYSSVSDDGILNIQNTATGDQSKLYTEAWWNYGVVGASGADSYMLNAEATVAEIALLAQYTHADIDHKLAAGGAKGSMDEFTVTAGKSFGPLDATLAYIYTDVDTGANHIEGFAAGTNDASSTIQAYLSVNF